MNPPTPVTDPTGAHPTPRTRPRVGIACSHATRGLYLAPRDLDRLAAIADVAVEEFEVTVTSWTETAPSPGDEERLARFAAALDVLVVCHGAPRVGPAVFAAAPRLAIVGEVEGDRFAGRIDVAAAREAGVTVIDTSHSSSWPVAEWALALSLVGLREHARFRDVIAGRAMDHSDYRTKPPARELTGRRVGLIGFGHIAWRLCELLAPFHVEVLAHDPYAPRELADALRVDFAPLSMIMGCDVVICLAPATPRTQGMIGAAELDLLRPGAVFVNVSRGAVVEVASLIAKAARGDAWFALDAHDPEPIAVDSPLRGMRNVFISPHIGGMTEEAQPRFFALMVDEIARWAEGREPRAQLTERVIAGRRGD